jgi:hypothetical protein
MMFGISEEDWTSDKVQEVETGGNLSDTAKKGLPTATKKKQSYNMNLVLWLLLVRIWSVGTQIIQNGANNYNR